MREEHFMELYDVSVCHHTMSQAAGSTYEVDRFRKMKYGVI
jgi:hypothetical protein